MRMGLAAAALTGVLTFFGTPATPAMAVDAGDIAPDFEGKEFINTNPISLKKLRGRVVFLEIFQTW